MNENSITVGEFRTHLEGLNDDDILHLPGGLGFYQIRRIGEGQYMIEQSEPEMYADDEFRAKNPNFKVGYMILNDHGDAATDINGGVFDPTIR